MKTNKIIVGIEAGGTKFNCAIAKVTGEIIESVSIATLSPEITLQRVKSFLDKTVAKHRLLEAIGIGSFGPVDLDPNSSTYGFITTTPKPGWKNTDILGFFTRHYKVPIVFETDVNCAAIGERCNGAIHDTNNLIYVTVGTGIGAGIINNGRLFGGACHPEIGHMLVNTDMETSNFEGNCSFHRNCLEGLASGPAIKKRWGCAAQDLPQNHQAWQLQANYLAQMCVNLTLCFSPSRIVLGGGVMKQIHLFPMIHSVFKSLLNGYIQSQPLSNLDSYITPSLNNGQSGLIGAVELAKQKIVTSKMNTKTKT